MNTIQIIAMVVAGLACLWVLAIFAVKTYVDNMSTPKRENFATQLTRVPRIPSEETHDVLMYSLGHS